MPWKPEDATKFTKKATTACKREAWAKTANAVLKSGKSEAAAVRIANAAVQRACRPNKKS